MNATLEAYLQMFCDYTQSNWAFLLPMAQLTICSRDAVSTGVSPFFLDHGYNVEPVQLEEDVEMDLSTSDTDGMRVKGHQVEGCPRYHHCRTRRCSAEI